MNEWNGGRPEGQLASTGSEVYFFSCLQGFRGIKF